MIGRGVAFQSCIDLLKRHLKMQSHHNGGQSIFQIVAPTELACYPLQATGPLHLPGKVQKGLRPNSRNTQETVLARSEEHTSELQSRPHLVCRLLLEKKKKKQ